MRLYLVRHGETEPNRSGIALGRADVPLTEHGLEQANRIADRLAEERIGAVYASPLRRSQRTAEAIAAPHGLEVKTEDGLIEMDVGEFDGLTYAELREKHPEFLERWVGPEGPDHAMPGGERLRDVLGRADATVRRLGKKHRDESVVAVTHNFVILSLLTKFMGLDLSAFRRLRHGVAGVTTVEVRPGRARIVSMNDCCHLSGM